MSTAFLSPSCQRLFVKPAPPILSSPAKRQSPITRTAVKCTQTLKPAASPRQQVRKPSADPRLAAEGDSVRSTPFQQAVFASFLATASALAVNNASRVNTPQEALASLAAVALSYLFTDFAVGVYHHAVDNYGSEKTPVFGYQIASFQGHHSFPWTITARDVPNNLYRLTYPTLPQLLALIALPLPSTFVSFYGSFLCFIVMSQETHRQAHMTRAAPWVRFLQQKGFILSQKEHAAHHRAPPSGSFEGNYCILSGVWNGVLDGANFFRLLEAVIYTITGTEPICWSLDHKVKEQALAMLPARLR